MTFFKSIAVALLAVAGLSSVAASAALVPRHRHRVSTSTSTSPSSSFLAQSLSIPRGGAGPLPVDDTAKAVSALYLTHALYQKLAPAKSAEAYGLGDITPRAEWFSEFNSEVNLALGIASTLLFWKTPSTPERAVGAGLLLGPVLGNVKSLLNDTPEGSAEGFEKTQLLNLAVNTATAHALLTGADYANTALKVYAAWLVANGVLCALSPSKAIELWGGDAESTSSETDSVLTRVVGQDTAALGTFCGAIALGCSPEKALGYALVPILANIVKCQFVDDTFGEAGIKDGPILGWVVTLLVSVVTLAVELPEAAASAAE
eukprot:CAMPEP_0178548648 /NCGR_PEP_ID=MMETSP0697-20121206/5315_1 /TAXON_ID=265572 /ORGANISM="Extubocellulus spinifer, Strain CCMP396" /LENGTH=317 /DNA_ID=CAMNT_0020181351 /DNA_START=72 /DNA_END=1025 /DNA_ORIENTATION=+